MSRAVVFTVHNRTEYFSETLASWNRAREKDFWFWRFCIEPSEVALEQFRQAKDFLAENRLPGFPTINPVRYGVLLNPFQALNTAFETHRFVALAEEDIVVSQDILEYYRWASCEYEKDPEILTVHAYQAAPVPQEAALGDVQREAAFSAWGWGTWQDRWQQTIAPSWDFDYSSGESQTSGWDWNLTLRVMPRTATKGLYPLESRTQHIGQHGGVHMKPEDFPSMQSSSYRLLRDKTSYLEL